MDSAMNRVVHAQGVLGVVPSIHTRKSDIMFVLGECHRLEPGCDF